MSSEDPLSGRGIAAPEAQPQKIFTFVYRGDNPYMDNLVESVRQRGHYVEVRKLPTEEFSTYEQFQNKGKLKESLGELKGKVVTDNTMASHVAGVHQGPIINTYEIFRWNIESEEDLVEKILPAVDAVRAQGKTPVILETRLGDHVEIKAKLSDRLKSEVKAQGGDFASWYASVLGRNLNIPVIPRSDFSISGSERRYNVPVTEALESAGITKENAVLFVDHHVYNLGDKETVRKAGFSEIPIVLVCPCCAGLRPESTYLITQRGFILLPLPESLRDSQIEETTEKIVALG